MDESIAGMTWRDHYRDGLQDGWRFCADRQVQQVLLNLAIRYWHRARQLEYAIDLQWGRKASIERAVMAEIRSIAESVRPPV